MNHEQVLVRPRTLTEKATNLQSLHGQFVFEVHLDATKPEIAQAVESLYSVKVQEVRTLTVRGKMRRIGRRKIKRSNWKKAFVQLAEGQVLDVFAEQ